MFEVLAFGVSATRSFWNCRGGTFGTDARTLENSEVGDMTKLSLVLDQDMRCRMLVSSSILFWKLATLDD